MSVASEFPGVTPQLRVGDTDAAIQFYRVAFGADELVRSAAPDGRVFHAELLINGGRLLLHDDLPGTLHPDGFAAAPIVLHLYVRDVDAVFAAAVAAGATSVRHPENVFWGDRYAVVRDPFGHHWSLATPREDLSADEVRERGEEWARRHPS
jgi:PhnB protein